MTVNRTPEQLELEAERIFLDALDLPAQARASFISDATADDPQLTQRVRDLLANANAAPSDFLVSDIHAAPFPDAARAQNQEEAPRSIGPYTVLRLIGVGGMGAVYEAVESETQCKVAIKLLQSAFATPSQLARFRREAGILANLDHPAIAKFHGVGTTETVFGSHPYIAMEFIDGRDLRKWGFEKGRSIRQKIEMMATICDAVHASHVQGVVHRDLKPANILVDASDQPRILDFGVSRMPSNGDMTSTIRTQTEQFIGTLAYMSPEQLTENSDPIDARSDIFSLGVVLYELLSGELPFDVADRSFEHAARLIREANPTELSRYDAAFRGNLATIAAKALEKSPALRYPTAGAMAQDLRRHLESEPIEARQPGPIRKFAKFSRRHRKLVAGVLFIFAALLVTTFLATHIALRESRLRALAERKTYRATLLSAQLALQNDNIVEAQRLVNSMASVGAGTWEYRYLRNCLTANAVVLARHTDTVKTVDLSPDGKHILSSSRDGTLRIWTIADKTSRVIRGHDGPVRQGLFLKRASKVASLSDDGTIRIWDVGTLQEVQRIRGNNWTPNRMDVSPDETRIAATCSDQRIRIWGLQSGRLLLTSAPHDIPISTVRYLNDERLLIGEHRGLSCWSAVTCAWLSFSDGGFDFHPSSISISDNASRFVTSCTDSTITLWDADAIKPRRHLKRQLGGVNDAVISPDGTRIATAGGDGSVRIWRADDGEEIARFVGHSDAVHTVAFVPDTSLIVSGGADRTVRIWDLDEANRSGGCRVLAEHERYVYDVAYQPNANILASAAWDGTVRFWDTTSWQPGYRLDADPERVECLAFNPQGSLLATGTSRNKVRLWDSKTFELTDEFSLPHDSVKSLAFDPTGAFLLAVRGSPHRDRPTWNAVTWRLDDKVEISRFESKWPLIAVPSATGLRLVEAIPGNAKLIDPLTTAQLLTFRGHDDRINDVSFSHDGSRFLTSSDDGTAIVWDARHGTQLRVLRGHSDKVYAAVFSPDGKRIATGSNDDTIRLWDAEDYDELLVLRGHTKYIYSLAFSQDGTTLVSGSGDHTIRVWSATAGE